MLAWNSSRYYLCVHQYWDYLGFYYRQCNPNVNLSIFLFEDLNDFFSIRKLIKEQLDDLKQQIYFELFKKKTQTELGSMQVEGQHNIWMHESVHTSSVSRKGISTEPIVRFRWTFLTEQLTSSLDTFYELKTCISRFRRLAKCVDQMCLCRRLGLSKFKAPPLDRSPPHRPPP